LGGIKVLVISMARCREHHWEYRGGIWMCARCQEEAAAKDPEVLPCPACGAKVEPKLIYCDTCLARLYRLGINDG
jgi:hypothetical protein